MEERTDVSKDDALNATGGPAIHLRDLKSRKRAGTEWVSVSARLNGLWPSQVGHSVRDRETAGSNPANPT